MANYLLDTTVLIEHMRDNHEVTALIKDLLDQGHRIGICGINVAELYSGVPPEKRMGTDFLVSRFEYFHLEREMAREAGRYRYEFARQGIALSTTDALIAAAAVAEDATLITGNIKDFPMADVRLLPHG